MMIELPCGAAQMQHPVGCSVIWKERGQWHHFCKHVWPHAYIDILCIEQPIMWKYCGTIFVNLLGFFAYNLRMERDTVLVLPSYHSCLHNTNTCKPEYVKK